MQVLVFYVQNRPLSTSTGERPVYIVTGCLSADSILGLFVIRVENLTQNSHISAHFHHYLLYTVICSNTNLVLYLLVSQNVVI